MDEFIKNEIIKLILGEIDEEFDGDILDAFEPFSDYEITIKEMYFDDNDELITDVEIKKRG